MALTIVGILVKDHNCRAKMGGDKASSSSKWKVLDHALPNSSDISFVECGFSNDPNITACHTTIGTTIHEGAEDRGCGMIGKLVVDRGHADAAVVFSSNRDNFFRGWCRNFWDR